MTDESTGKKNQAEGFFKYFIASEDDERCGLYITTCGHTLISPGTNYPPDTHPNGYRFTWANGRVFDDCELLYITDGSGVFESRSVGTRLIGPGSVVIVQPGEWHRYAPASRTGWTEYWVSVRGKHLRTLLRDFFPTPISVVKTGLRSDLLTGYVTVLDLAVSEPIAFQQLMAGQALTILAILRQTVLSRGIAIGRANETITHAKFLIQRDLSVQIEPQGIAEQLNVSYAWLRYNFKKHTGMPMTEYQLQARMLRAQMLLANTDKNVSEIGYQCGFDDSSYFSRIFKKKNSQSPSQYRKDYRRQTTPMERTEGN